MRHALGLPALALQQAVLLEALAVVLEIAAKKKQARYVQLTGTHDCLYAWKVEEVERSATALVMIHYKGSQLVRWKPFL